MNTNHKSDFRPKRSRSAGLSLVELLVSLAITAMLLTATMVAIDASFQAYAAAAESATDTHVPIVSLNLSTHSTEDSTEDESMFILMTDIEALRDPVIVVDTELEQTASSLSLMPTLPLMPPLPLTTTAPLMSGTWPRERDLEYDPDLVMGHLLAQSDRERHETVATIFQSFGTCGT